MQELTDHTLEDDEAINALLDAMKGGAEAERQRGTLLNYVAALAHPRVLDPNGESQFYLTIYLSHSLSICTATIKFPRQFNHIKNLRSINIYILLLRALQHQYPQKQIVSDSGASKKGTMFQSRHATAYATANIRGIKYGASTNHRGKQCCYAYIYGRAAARIEYILSISIPQENTPAIELNLAIIRRFQVVQNKPVMPWSLWCVNC